MKKKLSMTPVRANVRGTCAVQATLIVAVPPGSMACGRGTAITVSSNALSSSGAMKRFDEVRSVAAAPAGATTIDVMSMRPQSSCARGLVSTAGPRPVDPKARSRMNVDCAFFHAFQYRWNWRSAAGFVVMLRQVMTAVPVMVCAAGSRRAAIV